MKFLLSYICKNAFTGFLMLLLTVLVPSRGNGQNSVNWNLKSSFIPSLCEPNLYSATSPTASGSGVTASSTPSSTYGYYATGFPTSNKLDSTYYFQYTFTNNSGSNVTLSSFNISCYFYANGASSSMNVAFAYSTNSNFSSPTNLIISPPALNSNINSTYSNNSVNATISNGATIYFRIYGYGIAKNLTNPIFGNTSLTLNITGDAPKPSSFSAVPVSSSQINISGTSSSSSVMLVYNTSNTFGVPVNGISYTSGSSISGGGTVLYVGAGGSPFYNHTGLQSGLTYYYQLYSVNSCNNYYSTPASTNSTLFCGAPAAQPTSLVLSSTNTSISGSFTASASASGYLVVRTSGAVPTSPSNIIQYPAGSSALGGTIVYSGTSTSFTDNSLNNNASYSYYVFAYNNSNCQNGPVYNTNAPLTTTTKTQNYRTWTGVGSGGIGADFNAAANWSPTGAPGASDSLIFNVTDGSQNYTVNLSANTALYSLTLIYSATQNNSSTFTLNTGSNSLTTAGNLTAINSSSSSNSKFTLALTVGTNGSLYVGGNLSATNTPSAGGSPNFIYFNSSGTMTIAGTTLANTKNGVTTSQVGFLVDNAPATITFIGSVTFDDGSSTGTHGSSGKIANNIRTKSSAGVGISGMADNSNGSIIFKNDLHLGNFACSGGFSNGYMVFDASVSQTLYDSLNWFYWDPGNITVGASNNPTVSFTKVFSARGNGSYIDVDNNVTVNGSSVLVLPVNEELNNYSFTTSGTATGSFTLNGTSVLKIGDVTGGQTGSNFPGKFASYPFAAGSNTMYNGTSPQTIYSGANYGSITISNPSSGGVTAGGNLSLTGSMNIMPSAIFNGSSYTHSIGGNTSCTGCTYSWANNGSFTPVTSTIVFNGTSPEIIGGASLSQFYNLKINNPAGVSLVDGTSNAKTVTNNLILTSGYLTTSSSNLLILNNGAATNVANAIAEAGDTLLVPQYNSPYVNGPMRKIGNQRFVFPVGVTGTGCVPVGISAPANSTDAFDAQYIRSNASLLGPISSPNLYNVSLCDYWTLTRSNGNPTINVTGYWNQNSPCNGESPGGYVTDLTTISLAHFNNTNWNDNSISTNSSTVGNTISGGITWSGVSGFSPFALGNNSAAKVNPLPIIFYYFTAEKAAGFNALSWKVSCNTYNTLFEIQSAADGKNFVTIHSIKTTSPLDCSGVFDYHDYSGAGSKIYYRIKMTDQGNQVNYSEIRMVNPEAIAAGSMSIHPNPVVSGDATIVILSPRNNKVELTVLNMDGRDIYHHAVLLSAGENNIHLHADHLAKGIYIIRAVYADGTTGTIKFIKQ